MVPRRHRHRHRPLLVADGAPTAVIDFGTSGVGDPACDLVIAWGMFSGDSREAFRRTVAKDAGTWARARGWSLWKSLLVMSESLGADPERTASHHRVIDELLADHDDSAGSATERLQAVAEGL
ncbi:phosphotransferase [Streptomyces sp. NBC_00145]|uniref:phosphotransferase n=1 Tax=Streptomyces sp. NBC_00145 TaxID=2975666 RepID=UPI002E1832F6